MSRNIMINLKNLIVVSLFSGCLLACNTTENIPRETIIGAWSVNAINDQVLNQQTSPVIIFNEDMTLSGSASCNNIASRYRSINNKLVIDSIALTRKMCAPELMRQESTFLEYLNKVNSFEFLNGELLLIDPRGKLLVKAKRIKQ